jgi:type IV pilus assembly protein PilW
MTAMPALSSRAGFTLLELMVAMAVTAILLAGIYATYITQLRAHLTQQLTVEMQQNLRAAMEMMTREIRMAGYDPTRSAGAGITTMLGNSFRFTVDLNANGTLSNGTTDTNEDIEYGINGNGDLGRQTQGGGGLQALVENIDALNFVYLDGDRNIATNPADVRSVQVTLVGRSSRVLPALFNRQMDTRTYRNQQGQVILPAQNDFFRRMIVTSEIKCRNLG